MKAVNVRHPGLSVLLRKNIGRTTVDGIKPVNTRFSGQARAYDLTPLVGEAGAVRIGKSIREPAGAWTVRFGDRANADASDTLYGLLEPMDVVEIRMTGDLYRHPSGGGSTTNIPIMMRGLVTRVERSEAIGPDGKPQRYVEVSGQDYGKIWQMLQLVNSPFVDPTANLLTSMPFYARFGETFNTQAAGPFVRDVFDQAVNPFITRMAARAGGGSSPLQQIDTSRIEVKDGRVSPFGLGGWGGGTIYSLLEEHCDLGTWNELYIDDFEAGPAVVYRPKPFLSIGDKRPIMPIVSQPVFVPVSRADVISMTVARSDENVANYFWVNSPRFMLNFDQTLKLWAYKSTPTEVYDNQYGNNSPDLYGFRQMEVNTQQVNSTETNNGNGTPDGGNRNISESDAVTWMNTRRAQLREANRDNVMFETGSMTIKGNEAVRAGTYLRLQHGNMVSDYYVMQVMHDYIPFGAYTTTIVFERGTGFADRVVKGDRSASPYWSEQAEG